MKTFHSFRQSIVIKKRGLEWQSYGTLKRWQQVFSEIDAQHKGWIRRVNEFDDAVINHKGHEVIQNTLDFLAAKT